MTTQKLYADGGCITRNPSDIGGAYAWVLVDEHDHVLKWDSGVIVSALGNIPAGELVAYSCWLVLGTVGNNLAEYIAAVLALEAMPVGWSGTFYSDSANTIGRLWRGYARNGIPYEWIMRARAAINHLGTVTPVLLQGHPTRADLERGIGAKRGLPVSKWNKWCDEEATSRGKEYLEALNAARGAAVGVG